MQWFAAGIVCVGVAVTLAGLVIRHVEAAHRSLR